MDFGFTTTICQQKGAPMTRSGPFHAEEEHSVECANCGSTDVYRSRRSLLERSLNWIFRYHQRPFHCSTCKSRFWVRLDPHVWRRVMRLEIRLTMKRLKWYAVVILIAALIAWVIYVYEAGLMMFEKKALEVWENTDLTPSEQR